MTVSTELSHEEYVGNGVTTDFDFRFRIFESKHLIVVVADSEGNETTLKNGTDYTIVGAGSYHGGKVVLNKPLAQGWKILLERDLPVVQETDLRNQGKFFAEVHEDAFDYLTMLIQKALGTFSLSLRKPTYLSNYYDAKGNRIANLALPKVGTDAANKEYVDNSIKDIDSKTLRVKDKPINALPNTEQRANKILAFDDNGQPITVLPESGSASDVLIELAKPTGASLVKTNTGDTVQECLDNSNNLIWESNKSMRSQIPIRGRQLIINAHRGYSETYFEQTLLAFSQCRADAIEIDMQTTSDGVAVCFHDDDLSIQTTGKGAIKDNTIQQIRTYRYKRAQNTRYADMLSIPSLSAVCRVAARTGKKLLAEIKGYRTIDDCSQYNTIISTYGLAPTTTFICFDFPVLQYLHNINSASSYGYIIASYDPYMDANIDELISWGGGVIGIARAALPKIGIEKLRQWEANGLTINSWTIYTVEQLNEVLSYGIRHLTLDKDFADILNK
ncbi:glycerophosphodiester phosphodiesterase family protein [Proteus mirabilis]|uniref:glycerophosphodiester phosphodiesterase family protein n=1 Tax=Proteus mirabilis TaxID=584 RepID=UPI00235FFCDB|nr:glycerophosphodiester phosphodiesterase family protein [Proteus mirabilis]MDC9786379.1 glycerophosphodiester phosphodiesterase family protein [Proteus mirabilis]